MANVQVAGFQPIHKGGQTCEMTRKRVLTNNTTAIFKGDALDTSSDGAVIVTATTDGEVYSVQWGGASYMSGQERLERRHLPAATLYTSSGVDPANASYVYCVADTGTQSFLASIDEAVALTDIDLNFAMVLGTGSTTSGLSGHELDATGKATTATIPWRLQHIVTAKENPRNDPDAADSQVIVKINAGRRDPELEPSGTLGN